MNSLVAGVLRIDAVTDKLLSVFANFPSLPQQCMPATPPTSECQNSLRPAWSCELAPPAPPARKYLMSNHFQQLQGAVQTTPVICRHRSPKSLGLQKGKYIQFESQQN